MSQISNTITQVNKVNTYSGSIAGYTLISTTKNFKSVCEANRQDWKYDVKVLPFDRATYLCSGIDATECPNIAGGVAATTWNQVGNTAKVGFEQNNTKPIINCFYNVDGFNTLDDVNGYIINWIHNGIFDDNLNNHIMPHFCAQQSKNCINDPKTGIPFSPGCSYLSDSGDAGTLCRTWANINPQQADSIRETYCGTNDTPDCACENRSSSPVYQLIKAGNPYSDGCWYIPCANPDSYLVPTSLINQPCPTQVCEIVNEIIAENKGKIDIGSIKQSITCDVNGDGDDSFFENNKWLIIIIVGLFFLIIVFLVIASTKRKKI